jgi:phage-related protein
MAAPPVAPNAARSGSVTEKVVVTEQSRVDPAVQAGFTALTQLLNQRFAAVTQLLTNLQKQVQTMSTTLSGQLDQITQTLAQDMSGLASDLTTIAGELTPGSTITQAQVDALNAVATSANTLKQQADALAQATAAPASAQPTS